MLGRALLLLVPLILAGCAAPAATETPPGTDDVVAAAFALEPITIEVPVSATLAMPGIVLDDIGAEGGSFEVPEGYANLTAVADITCATPTCGWGYVLTKDGEVVESSPDGSAPLAVRVSPGEYAIYMRSTGPAAVMSGKITITLEA